MTSGALSLGFILSAIFTTCVLVFGVFLLWVRAERVERPILVGGLTILTSGLAIAILVSDLRQAFPSGTATLVSVCLVSVLGFAVGRGIDYVLGPVDPDPEDSEATLGADLAD